MGTKPEAAAVADGVEHTEKTLHTENLVKTYSKRRVVNEGSVDINPGEIVGLLGPNGAGKTTTFYMVVGIIRPNEGRVFIGEEDITKLPMYKRARKGIQYLAQEASIFRKLTVEENVMAILQTLPLKKNKRKERCDELLEVMGVAHLRKEKAYTLSGGERRRGEIARALTTSPEYLLLDEPFAGIDPIAVEDIQVWVEIDSLLNPPLGKVQIQALSAQPDCHLAWVTMSPCIIWNCG